MSNADTVKLWSELVRRDFARGFRQYHRPMGGDRTVGESLKRGWENWAAADEECRLFPQFVRDSARAAIDSRVCNLCQNTLKFSIKTIDGDIERDCIYCCARDLGSGVVVQAEEQRA